MTGSAKPPRCNSPPRSRTSANGATRGEAPPSISLSAAANDCRNSVSVAPPTSAATNKPSGLSTRRICTSVPGRSLTNCSDSAETTRSKAAAPNGSASSSATTKPVAAAAFRRAQHAPLRRHRPTERPLASRAARHPACRDRARGRSAAHRSPAARRGRRRRYRAESSRLRSPARGDGARAAAPDRRLAGLVTVRGMGELSHACAGKSEVAESEMS